MLVRFALPVLALTLLAASHARADARQRVIEACNKLADADGYAWSSQVEGGMGRGGRATEGKRLKDGLTHLSMQMREEAVQAVFRGEKGAVQTPDGWLSLEQAGRGDDSGRPGPGLMLAAMVRAFKPPVEQAKELAEQAESLAVADDGSIAGALTEESAKSLMQMRRRAGGPGGNPDAARPAPEIADAKGAVAFWIDADGRLSKVRYSVSGVMNFNGEEREINRTTTVQIKDVNATTIDVPAEATSAMGD